VEISGGELHHMLDVLRLREGDEFSVLDGMGGVYEASLISCSRDAAFGKIKTFRRAKPSTVEVSLFAGLPKADKMDMIVQKATELGAHLVVPVLCQHTVSHLSAKRAQQRVDRWRQIAIEASKQSRRPLFPVISDVLSFDEAIDGDVSNLKIICVSRESLKDCCDSPKTPERLKDVLQGNSGAKKISVFVGAEGGFADGEIQRAISAGATAVSLGSNILRTETAAIAVLTIVLYEKDAAYGSWEEISDVNFSRSQSTKGAEK